MVKIDLRCPCKGDNGYYMEKVSFKPSKCGEIGTIEFHCSYCGNTVFMEIDI